MSLLSKHQTVSLVSMLFSIYLRYTTLRHSGLRELTSYLSFFAQCKKTHAVK